MRLTVDVPDEEGIGAAAAARRPTLLAMMRALSNAGIGARVFTADGREVLYVREGDSSRIEFACPDVVGVALSDLIGTKIGGASIDLVGGSGTSVTVIPTAVDLAESPLEDFEDGGQRWRRCRWCGATGASAVAHAVVPPCPWSNGQMHRPDLEVADG